MSLDTTPLGEIEHHLHQARWLRRVLVADLRVAYRWLWFQRAMGVVCLGLGISAAFALARTEGTLWWLNLLGAVLNFVLVPYNLWTAERSWARQLRDVAVLPTAIDTMKRMRAAALRCPLLAPLPGPMGPCSLCRGMCPFQVAVPEGPRVSTSL